MGQQQLLLLILAAIVVGIAVAGGIVLFRAGAVSAARDAVALDLEDIGTRAHAYYRKPRNMAGGAFSFSKPDGSPIDIINLMSPVDASGRYVNSNGRYYIDGSRSSRDSLTIVGKGFEVVGTDTVQVEVVVGPRSIRTVIIY